MSIARTVAGVEGAILIDANGAVVLSTDGGGGGSTSVWSAADAAANGMTLSNGGLTVTNPNTGYATVRGTISQTTGKYYVEFKTPTGTDAGGPSADDVMFGIASASFISTNYLGSSTYSAGFDNQAGGVFVSSGFTHVGGGANVSPVPANDVWMIAVDLTAGKVWLGRNNAWLGGDPASGANPPVTIGSPALGLAFFPGFTAQGPNGGSWTLQATAASQTYAPPAGFSAWDGGAAPPPTSVWSASDAAANGMTLTNGGLTVTPSGGAWQSIRGSISKNSGKLYVEFSNSVAATDWQYLFGLANSTITLNAAGGLGNSNYSCGTYIQTSNQVSAGFTSNYTSSLPDWQAGVGVVYGIAIDFAAGKIWVSDNGVWSNSSDPVAGTLPIISFTPATVGALFPAMSFLGSGHGVWTLQATAASQKYAPPSGFSAWDSAAPTHSPQALAYLARTVGGNEGGNGTNIANLIDGLVADGVWAKLDCLYVLAQQNQTDALLNLVGTSYTAVNHGSAWTIYKGFLGTYVDTTFNPSTATSPNYLQNSASFGFWSYATILETVQQMDTGSYSGIYSYYTGPVSIGQLNGGGQAVDNAPPAKGLVAVDRALSANFQLFWNGVSKVTQTGASVGVDAGGFLLGYNSAQTLSAAFIGASLGSAGQLALYNRLRTYMTTVGVP